MMPRADVLGAQRGILRAAMEQHREAEKDEDWQASMMAKSLVNYAAAPIGSKKYDSNWLASNTAAR